MPIKKKKVKIYVAFKFWCILVPRTEVLQEYATVVGEEEIFFYSAVVRKKFYPCEFEIVLPEA